MSRLLAALLCLSAACAGPATASLDIATTSSVQNSGLLPRLLPAIEQSTGIVVRAHTAGSGRALQMLADGVVDAVISHAPDAEQRLLARHADWSYRKIAHNSFVVAGPATDPAGVRGSADAVDAFRRIVNGAARFVSRGDESGTHERERAFWSAAGRQPEDGRLIVSGRGMAQALRHASEAQAYVLTDAPTFRQLAPGLDLVILFDRDPQLMNTYAVVHRRGHPGGDAFAAWLTGDAGRVALESFQIDGQSAFAPWPPNCPGERPADLPC